jgi:hypothetical protein
MSATYTLTFSECVENHKGMEMIGKKSDHGFTFEDLYRVKEHYEGKGKKCEMFCLNDFLPDEIKDDEKLDEAYILVIRKALENDKKLFDEQKVLEMDTKAFMRGRVVNKAARWNLCFADISQEPEYEIGKGRLVNFDDVPLLKEVREQLAVILGMRLYCEGNYYYDVNKCYIGEHGDGERKYVVGLRLGASFYLNFRWFQRSVPISDFFKLVLNSGDMYMMSEKATGNDWLKKIVPTLRHSACSDASFSKVDNK